MKISDTNGFRLRTSDMDRLRMWSDSSATHSESPWTLINPTYKSRGPSIFSAISDPTPFIPEPNSTEMSAMIAYRTQLDEFLECQSEGGVDPALARGEAAMLTLACLLGLKPFTDLLSAGDLNSLSLTHPKLTRYAQRPLCGALTVSSERQARSALDIAGDSEFLSLLDKFKIISIPPYDNAVTIL